MDEVVFALRSFEAYPILVKLAGARPVRILLDDAEGHDLDAMAVGTSEAPAAFDDGVPAPLSGAATAGLAMAAISWRPGSQKWAHGWFLLACWSPAD